MHNPGVLRIIFDILLTILIFLSRNYTTGEYQDYRNCSCIFSEEGKRFEYLLHSNLLENNVIDVENSTTELYNVTFTDVKGRDILVIFNRTVILEWIYDEDITFAERRREDSFVKTSPAETPQSLLLLGMRNNVAINMCSGTLLTPQWLLTSAQCPHSNPKPNSFLVYAGGSSVRELLTGKTSEGSQVSTSNEFYAHPNCSVDDNNISVVKVEPFNLTKTVNIASLSTEPWVYNSYKDCNFTGFGKIHKNVLNKYDGVRKTHTFLVKKPCICSFMLKKKFGKITVARYICSKPQKDFGLCAGDSGGGLICDGQMKAIAMSIIQMWDIKTCQEGYFSFGGLKCGSVNTLTVFQDTCPFLPWINSYVKMFNESEISPKCVHTVNLCTNPQPYKFLIMFCISCFLALYKY